MLTFAQDTAGQTADQAATGAEQAAGTAPTETMQNELSKITSGNVSDVDWMALWADVGWPALKAIILVILVLIVASWAKRIITGTTTKAKVDQTLARFFGNIAKWAILVLGALALLSTFGIETTSFAAVIAAAGFAVGMAMSGTLGNFAAGIMLLVFRPFKVGDVVNVAGVTAKVDEIDLFTTTMDTADNRRFIVPNGKIFGDTIENITFHEWRRVEVAVGTEYPADLDQVRQVLTEAATNVEGRLQDKEPIIYLLELGDSSINWSVRVFCPTADFWAVRERLTRDVKVALDKAGIGIPFPQRDVHLFVESGNASASA